MVVNPALQVKAWGPGELKSLDLEYELYLKHGIFFFFNIRYLFYLMNILLESMRNNNKKYFI